jgi:hypothetical protein
MLILFFIHSDEVSSLEGARLRDAEDKVKLQASHYHQVRTGVTYLMGGLERTRNG